MRYLLGSLTTGLVVLLISLLVLVCILVPQMSVADHQTGVVNRACLPTLFGQGTSSRHAPSMMSAGASSSMAGATSCIGNQTIVRAALALVGTRTSTRTGPCLSRS